MSMENTLDYFLNFNRRFLLEMKTAAQVDPRTLITLVPSAIFMVGAFVLVFRIFHRKTHRLTPYRVRIYRELGFHWTYFYLIRIWFLVVKIFRWGTLKVHQYVENSESFKTSYYMTTTIDILLFALMLCCSLLPFSVVFLKQYMRENIPDFLMWIGQDPWLRSEIGLAGHYLDRPVTFSLPKRSEYAYRSKRSTSTEETIQKEIILRNCKSMVTMKCVNSIDEMLV